MACKCKLKRASGLVYIGRIIGSSPFGPAHRRNAMRRIMNSFFLSQFPPYNVTAEVGI